MARWYVAASCPSPAQELDNPFDIEACVRIATLPSRTYELMAQAMSERKQVLCIYDDYRREVCPIVLGHTKGVEKALVYQFAGESSQILSREGSWKCFEVAKMRDIKLRQGPWHTGDLHQKAQTCVQDVDLDVNPASPYWPKRSL